MSKDLPYFKFHPSEWENGNIQMCSREAKGLFIDLCSMYWSRQGEVPYALALQKHCNGNATHLQELCKYEILVVDDAENIVIEFLDEQLSAFIKVSEIRRNAANKRWNDANAMQMHSKSNARREEKRKEDKSIDTLPNLETFLSYATEKKPNVDPGAVRLKYEAWVEAGWKTGGDKPKPIKNWKTTLLNTLTYLPEKKNGFNLERLKSQLK